MEYQRFGNTIFARLDKGEELCQQLEQLASREQIRLAQISGLGAVGDLTVGVFYTAQKEYHANSFQGDFEIVALHGTVTTKDGAYYAHLHMAVGDKEGRVFGGHLNRAVISATCELVIQVYDGTVERKFSDEIGLNLMEFCGQ